MKGTSVFSQSLSNFRQEMKQPEFFKLKIVPDEKDSESDGQVSNQKSPAFGKTMMSSSLDCNVYKSSSKIKSRKPRQQPLNMYNPMPKVNMRSSHSMDVDKSMVNFCKYQQML